MVIVSMHTASTYDKLRINPGTKNDLFITIR